MKGNTVLAISLVGCGLLVGGGLYVDAQKPEAPAAPEWVVIRDVSAEKCSMFAIDRNGDKIERVTVDFVCITATYPDVPVYVRQPDPAPSADAAQPPQ